jgi:hypothetical protein
MIKEKTSKIEKFIGIYDNYILPQQCDEAVKLFEKEKRHRKVLNRIQTEKADFHFKKDEQYFAGNENIDFWWDSLKPMLVNYDMAFRNYSMQTGANSAYGGDFKFYLTGVKIQKTLPGEGYHVWHIEHNKGYHQEARAFVYSIYLNDVKEGGETEFLHQSVRVKPKKGRIVIWPAGFPYVHRGNPPLAGEKYILTSWMMVR